ncbi:TadE/TadG family type IV pilus assembly protein [Microlunatus speluncae]|uniref:TadE/TadG family type IV pilus assembly protein n=1 Tax=Microlunatus speluncae TaxID=2594267 RepID=UPI0012667050|nr:TadE/TadG family type IV pilus assembly protein [Microlunatus speluncae]
MITRRSAERGTASIELIAIVPMVMFVVVVVFQVLASAYTVQAAAQAARDGARAYSLGRSPEAAVQASLPGAVRLVEVTRVGPHHGVRVTVQAPAYLVVGDRTVTREVIMP